MSDTLPSKTLSIPDGELWSLVRSLISQGTYIQMDATAGKYQTSEEVFMRIDEAAREKADEIEAKYLAPEPSDVRPLVDMDADDFTTCLAGVLVSTQMPESVRIYLNEARNRLMQRTSPPPCDVTADAARLRAYFNNANCISHPSLFYSSANPFASWCESIDQYMQERASVTNPAQPPPVAHSKSQQKRFVEMQQADAPPCVHPFAKLGIDADGVMWCVDCLKKPLVIPVPFGDETPQPPSAEHAWAYELFDIREDCARYGTPVEVVIVAPPSSAGTKGDAQ